MIQRGSGVKTVAYRCTLWIPAVFAVELPQLTTQCCTCPTRVATIFALPLPFFHPLQRIQRETMVGILSKAFRSMLDARCGANFPAILLACLLSQILGSWRESLI